MAFQQDGTKIQLASGGASWIHDNPGTNLFLPAHYTEYSHFGKEDVKLTPTTSILPGIPANFVLDNVGDVCINMYLKVKMNDHWKLPWAAERVMSAFRLYSGDTLLDTYDFNYNRYYYNFILNQDQKSKWDKMTSGTGQEYEEEVFLPLLFGFCQHERQTLPTLAMFNKKIRVEVDCGVIAVFGGGFTGRFKYDTVELWASVGYLQGEEKNRVKFTNEMLLLNTSNYEDMLIASRFSVKDPDITQKIDMQRCVKELFFGAYVEFNGGYPNKFPFEWLDEFNGNTPYSNVFSTTLQTCCQPHQSTGIVRIPSANYMGSGNVLSAQIVADKTNITPVMDQKFFNTLQPYFRHSGCSAPGYMCYSWALDPEITQPTGHINASLFRNIEVNAKVRQAIMDYAGSDNTNTYFQWFTIMIGLMKKRNGMLQPLSQE